MKRFFREELSFELAKTLSVAKDKCLCCGADVFDEIAICGECEKEFVFNNEKTCQRCGCKILGEADFCGVCGTTQRSFDRGFSVFVYQKEIVKIIHEIKFRNQSQHCFPLAKFLVEKAMNEHIDFDLVTYVPMTQTAKNNRGFNQAELLAQSFCNILKIPFEKDILLKTRDTKRQETLAFAQRQKNVENCFKVAKKELVKGKNVLLIDDVRTTGATSNECSIALKKAKCNKVYVLTVASVVSQLDFE